MLNKNHIEHGIAYAQSLIEKSDKDNEIAFLHGIIVAYESVLEK